MFRTDQLRDVVDVAQDDLGGRRAGAEEEADAVDADHAVRGGAGADQVVRNVARVVAQAARIRVREDDRAVARVDDLARGAVSRVRAAADHADAVHLREQRAPQRPSVPCRPGRDSRCRRGCAGCTPAASSARRSRRGTRPARPAGRARARLRRRGRPRACRSISPRAGPRAKVRAGTRPDAP